MAKIPLAFVLPVRYSEISAYVYFVKGLESLSNKNWSAKIYFFVVGVHGHVGLAGVFAFVLLGGCYL
jgi:hypothetical protein